MGEKRTLYKNQFNADKYDRIDIMVKKGRKKEIQEYLRSFNPRISVNEYINKLIDFDMEKDGK